MRSRTCPIWSGWSHADTSERDQRGADRHPRSKRTTYRGNSERLSRRPSPDQDGSMFFDHASFAYPPSSPDDATGNTAPVYPCWLLPLAQNPLAALADKALEQEITTEPMDRA